MVRGLVILLNLLTFTSVSAQHKVELCGDSVVLRFHANQQQSVRYDWYYNDIHTTTDSVYVLIYRHGRINLTLVVTDIETQCNVESSVFIDAIECYTFYAPNAFTPDGDGLNDTFYPEVWNATITRFQVYSRWGELIYSGLYPWPGSGVSGTYVWTCEYTDNTGKPHRQIGAVMEIR